MTWQLLMAAFVLLGAASYLLRRHLGKTAPAYNRFVNWFFYLGVLYPVGIVTALVIHESLSVSARDLLTMLAGELVFPLISLASYRASKDIDAGFYTIINNLTPIITITTAWLLLHEGLNTHQLLGAIIIISSAFLVTLPHLSRRPKANRTGLLFALTSIVLLGMAATFERYMLTQVSFSAYIIYGWGAQTLWMTILAWPQRKYIKLLKRPELSLPIVGYGLVSTLKGLCWIGALRLSGNASLVSTVSSFTPVIVVLSAYVILRERQMLGLKLAAAALGILGIIVLRF